MSWMEELGWALSHANDTDSEPFRIVDEIQSGYGYEWDQFTILRHQPTGRVFLYEGGGCSCNSAYDEYTGHRDDLTALDGIEVTAANLDDAVKQVRDYNRHEGESLSADRERMVRALWSLFPR